MSIYKIIFYISCGFVFTCSSLGNKGTDHKTQRQTISGYTQFEVFKDPQDGERSLLGYDEEKNTTKLCEGDINPSITKASIDVILEAKDTQSLAAGLPAGLSLPVEAKAQLEQTEITKITLKLINPKEYRLLNYRATEGASQPAYRDKRCIVGLLYAEKIQVNVQTMDSTKASAGVQIKEIELVVSKSLDSSSKSQKRAENVFVGYIATLPGVSRAGAVARSAMVPGWGQFYKGDNIKGSFFTGGFLLLTLLTSSNYATFQTKKSEYQSAQQLDLYANLSQTGFNPLGLITFSQVNGLASRVNDAGGRAQISLYGLGGLYLFNLFDAYFLGSVTGRSSTAGVGFRLHYAYFPSYLINQQNKEFNYELGIIGAF